MISLKRVGGATLIIISIVSLLFSLAALVGVWIVRKPITDTMTAGLALASDTLEVTGYTLGIVDDGLATAGDLVASTQRTVNSCRRRRWTAPLPCKPSAISSAQACRRR